MYAFIMEPPLARYTPDALLGLLMQYLPSVAISLIDFSIYTDLYRSVTGLPMSNKTFLEAGERIHVLERLMNTNEGISREDDTLPDRLVNQGRQSDNLQQTVPLDRMISRYYALRGYDSNGIPTPATLEKLQIR